jgi:hypothetical protein
MEEIPVRIVGVLPRGTITLNKNWFINSTININDGFIVKLKGLPIRVGDN